MTATDTRQSPPLRTGAGSALSLCHYALALAAYCVIATTMTWPMLWNMTDTVPQDLGDPLLSIWTLWWNAAVLPFTERWWQGPMFFPAADTLTLSDHRVGIGILTTPIIHLAGSPILAHNVAFLMSFVLSAIAAYVCAYAIVRERASAFIAGLVFGFNPFRAEHLSHLELLSSYWLPIIILAVHKWRAAQSPKWLAVLSVALLFQLLTGGYYFFFMAVMLGLWIIWFVRPRDVSVKQCVQLVTALSLPVLVMAPVLLKYRMAHESMSVSRSITEIEASSADVIGLLTAPVPLALWNSPASWHKGEGSIMPGLAAVMVVSIALWRLRTVDATRMSAAMRRFRMTCGVLALVALSVAVLPTLFGPVAWTVGSSRISVSAAYKPLSLAAIFASFWGLTSRQVTGAWARKSELAFYCIATVAMWVLAMGPTIRFMGERVIYKAPYSWLMLLPGFRDEFRVPARFAMIAALTLCIAAALALRQLTMSYGVVSRAALLGAIAIAVTAESWISPLPLLGPPLPLSIPAAVPPEAAVLELPLGVMEDARAIFRGSIHGHAVVNGMSGYVPPHYKVLQAAFAEGVPEVLTELAVFSPVAVFVDRGSAGAGLSSLLVRRTPAAALAQTHTHDVFLLTKQKKRVTPAVQERTAGLTISDLRASAKADEASYASDGNVDTVWVTPSPQRGDEYIVLDFGSETRATAVTIALGRYVHAFGREIAIDASSDAVTWRDVARIPGTVPAFVAAINDPRDVDMEFSFELVIARFLRVRQVGTAAVPWAIAEIRVFGN